jgi:hypothetical protein
MADISKCGNEDCVMKKNCRRYTVAPKEYNQSYNTFVPKRNSVENFQCDLFLKNEGISKNI